MKFQKDKKYEWMSATAPFEVEFASELEYYDIQATQPIMKKKVFRYEVDCFRNFSAYDSPKCDIGFETKKGMLKYLDNEIEKMKTGVSKFKITK